MQSTINFERGNGLNVTIDTERLHMRSVTGSEQDYEYYGQLFGNKGAMCKYATGEARTQESTTTRIKETWDRRWKTNDPYNGLAVFKSDEDVFLGHVVLGYGDKPGQSELAFLFMQQHWGQGYGTEAVTAVVQEYAPQTIARGYTLEGKPLEEIVSTSRPDNPASIKILEKVGMEKVGEEVKWGALRHHYSKKV